MGDVHDAYADDIFLLPPHSHKVNSVTFDLTFSSCGCFGLRNALVPAALHNGKRQQRPREEMQRRLARPYHATDF